MSRVFVLMFAVLAVLGMLAETAPTDSSDDPGDPSLDFPEDDEETGRGYVMTNVVGPGAIEGGLVTKHWRFFSRMLDDCGSRGLESCIGSKVLAFADSFLNMKSIPLYEGLALVRRNATEQEEDAAKLSERLGLNGTEGAGDVVEQLVEKFAKFLRTYSVQLRLPESNKDEVAFGLDEGRKMKKMLLPIVMGIGLKVLGVLPLIFGGLALLAGNALFVSKLAFVVASLVALSGIMNGVRDLGGGSQKIRIPLLSQLAAALPGASPTPSSFSSASWEAGNTYASGWSRNMDSHQIAYAAQAPMDEQ